MGRYFRETYCLGVASENVLHRLSALGSHVQDNVYHIYDFTVKVTRVTEGGPKSLLTVSGQHEHLEGVEGLLRELGS
ncbi:MAG: hypothetical protein WCV90_05760 [Candidatus Woesearchaeota archaeon]